MIGQTEVSLLSGKGPLIATFGYEKSDTRLYHFYRSNLGRVARIELVHVGFTDQCVKPLHHTRHEDAPRRARTSRLVYRLTVVEFDDLGFIDLRRELGTLGKPYQLAFELGFVKADVGHEVGGLLLGILYDLQALGFLLEGDHIADLDQEGGNVDLLAVNGDMTVGDQLTGLLAGQGEAEPKDYIVQALLADLQKGQTGKVLVLLGDGEVAAELTLGYPIGQTELLLLEQLLAVFGDLAVTVLAMLTGSIRTFGEFLASSQNRITEMPGYLPDRSYITRHSSFKFPFPVRARREALRPGWPRFAPLAGVTVMRDRRTDECFRAKRA